VIDGDLHRLAEAGLLERDAARAPEREELLRHLLDRLSVEEILFWSEFTNIWGIAARANDRPPPFISAREAAARAGVDLGTVLDLRAVLGFPVADPDAPEIPETVVDDVGAFQLGAELYGRDEALAFAHVLGWAAGRVAEAARALFGSSVERRGADSLTELDLAKANERGVVAWQQVQSLLVHLLAEHPLRNIGFAEALMQGELRVAVAFVDLVASTEWAQAVAPAEHSEALRRFEMQAARIAVDHGARLVKVIGDEVMLVADDPEPLARAAQAICAMAHEDPLLPEARGAVGFGAVTARDGDYFGPLVNAVAHATKTAAPGAVVVLPAP
jgi:adenylate cyclase